MRWKTNTYTGWGRALTASGQLARPERQSQVTPTAPAIGNRRSYGDAALNSGGRAMDMTRLDRILEFDTRTGDIHVEAGCTIGDLARVLPTKGWLPRVMPGTGFATVGGCIAMDVHGKNHHHAGSFGGHVREITLLTPDGPRVITPDDTSIWRATIGGLGQTGVIASARLSLMAVPGRTMKVHERRAENFDEHIAMLDASQATFCVGWVDAAATGASLGRGIVEEAETSGAEAKHRTKTRKIPFDAPGFALSAPMVRMFNTLYYRRVPADGQFVIRPIEDFFFPLDRVHDWNRLYGKTGFHQFQCVIPTNERYALRGMLGAIAEAGAASPLAVLKRMGPAESGHLSFSKEGFTLAVDFPNRGATPELIAHLIAQTIEANGRVYLAKDSLSTAAQARAMYTHLPEWAATVNDIDPERRLETDLTRRLALRTAI